MTCLYHGSNMDSSTFPNDVYTFIDSTPDNFDGYNDDVLMSEWFSLFGNMNDLFNQHHQPEEEHQEICTDDDIPCDSELKHLIEYWISVASDKSLSVDSNAVTILQDCLDLFFANIVEETDEESKRRVSEGERTLVPSLVGGILLSNKYLRFISNYGLRKPDPVL